MVNSMTIQVLVIGDFHIPTRAKSIPTPIRAIIEKSSFDYVLCTGDFVVRKVMDYVKKAGRNFIAVKGNMDYIEDLPPRAIVEIEGYRIGLTHGSEVFPRGNIVMLTKIAEEMNVDVLVHGHTHVLSIHEVPTTTGTKLLINPGSATGVYSGGGGSLIPSYMILEVSSEQVVVHGYEILGDKVSERRYVFKKTV